MMRRWQPTPRLGLGTKRPVIRLAQLVTARSLSAIPAPCNPCPLRCRIEPYLIKAAPRGAAGPASAPGSVLGGPPGARRAALRSARRSRWSKRPLTRSGEVVSTRSRLASSRAAASRAPPGVVNAMAQAPPLTPQPLTTNRTAAAKDGRSRTDVVIGPGRIGGSALPLGERGNHDLTEQREVALQVGVRPGDRLDGLGDQHVVAGVGRGAVVVDHTHEHQAAHVHRHRLAVR